jgi:hypothetical protein
MNPKVAPLRTPAESTLVRRAKIDLYGEVKRRLALSEPDEALAKVLKEDIESWHRNEDGDAPIVERGNLYELQLSPMRKERTLLDPRKAFNFLKRSLGLDGALAAITIPLAALDKVVPKSEQALFVAEERSGYRNINVVAIGPVAKAA